MRQNWEMRIVNKDPEFVLLYANNKKELEMKSQLVEL